MTKDAVIKYVKSLVEDARNDFNKRKYINAYSKYKKAYKITNDHSLIFALIDILFHSYKTKLIKNDNLKFNLIILLLNFIKGKDISNKYKLDIIYYKLKLYRELKFYDRFLKLYENFISEDRYNFLIDVEYIHYLFDIEDFDKAEQQLSSINKEFVNTKSLSIYKTLQPVLVDKKSFLQINSVEPPKIEKIKKVLKNINGEFDYIIVVSGTFKIFVYEMIQLLISLKNLPSNFLCVIYINDATEDEQNKIRFSLRNLNIINYTLIFENIKFDNFTSIQSSSFHTAYRFIIAGELIEEFEKPIFLCDADTIINGDLCQYIKENAEYDICLDIKEKYRYLWTYFQACHCVFYPNDKTKNYLKTYKNFIYHSYNNNHMIWHIDQIALYVSYVFLKRFDKNIKINSTIKGVGKYFNHILHNYL